MIPLHRVTHVQLLQGGQHRQQLHTGIGSVVAATHSDYTMVPVILLLLHGQLLLQGGPHRQRRHAFVDDVVATTLVIFQHM